MSNFCSTCGASVTGDTFCSNCGNPVLAGQPQQPTQLGQPTYQPYQPTQPVSAAASEYNAAMWCHLGALLAGLLALLIWVTALLTWLPALLIKQSKPNSAFIQHHARESMNFQIQWLILFIPMLIIGFISWGLGLLLFIPLGVFQLVVMIMASVAASQGRTYSYPMMFRVIN